MTKLPTIAGLQLALQQKQTSSEELTKAALQRIEDSNGEGNRAFTRVYRDSAIKAAQLSDQLRAAGLARSPLEGLPISVKDLFDVAGDITTAGSVVLDNQPAAQQHAQVVQRLVKAGGVLVGRTNMTEFAFSGLGINPHYGSPSSPWDRNNTARISGGSSSGAGVAVADGMSVMSLGTDTGGSVRIPSAFCSLTGFKPTSRRIPSQGSVPLSSTFDSIGPLAASVNCCAISDAIIANDTLPQFTTPKLEQLRFAIPKNSVFDDADDYVVNVFEATIRKLEQAGARIDTLDIPEFDQLAYINRNGGMIAAEAWAWHKDIVEKHQDRYDPRVVSRILRGSTQLAADYLNTMQERQQWQEAVGQRLHWYDAMLFPTTPVIAPSIQSLVDDEALYFRMNALILRNPTFINFLDGCALSMPCHEPGQAPVGLMVAGTAMQDARILALGKALETRINPPV